jgi:large subunit ribosomal protein L19
MSAELIKLVEAKFMKNAVVAVQSGDVVKVHQKIKEGSKERVQIFEGLVIRTDKVNSITSTIVVRRIASGVGVEKSFLMHSPTVLKVEVIRRNKVRRNYLSYMRALSGKSTKLTALGFDRNAVNDIHDEKAEAEEERIEHEQEVAHEVGVVVADAK